MLTMVFMGDRRSVAEAVSRRVRNAIGSNISISDALAVALVSTAHRDRKDVLGMLLNPHQSREAYRLADLLAITEQEWAVLFDSERENLRDGPVADLQDESAFAEFDASMTSALRCSLSEKSTHAAWQRPVCKAACLLALHGEHTEERIATCLGGLVRADSRRLDDMRSVTEDEGADLMLLTRTVLCLANCIVT